MDTPQSKLKLNIGSHSKKIPGYLNVDVLALDGVDVVADITERWPFDDWSAEKIVMEEVLEHISFHKTRAVLNEAYRVLAPGGELYIQVPDCGSMMMMYALGEVSEEVPHKPKSVQEVLEITEQTGMRVNPKRWLYAFTGAQKYGVPDIHKNIFTKESLEEALLDTGGWRIDFQNDPLGWKIRVTATKI